MINAIRGTKDILPGEVEYWQFLEDKFREVSEKFGYGEIRTPIFEPTEVFSRGIGEETDVVNKEMYTFPDRKGDSITLRPEKTAGIVRAILQHSLANQGAALKYWYFGPFFRYERPQSGRQRQFHQYGAECINSPYPESDVEIIDLSDKITKAAGIYEYKLLLNTLGNASTRKNYRYALVEFFRSKAEELSEDSRRRLETNPLRILDSKDERDIKCSEDAPNILEYLDDESQEHFEKVKEGLDLLQINYEIKPRLVRGLDYYCHTVFEFQSTALGAQDSFGGGGRYDGLFEQLGSKKPYPAVGFAMGVERMLLILQKIDSLPEIKTNPDIYIVVSDHKFSNEAQKIALRLREMHLRTVMDLQRRSMKAQFREANKMNVKYVIILGDEEIAKQSVQIKDMDKGEQTEISLDQLNKYNF